MENYFKVAKNKMQSRSESLLRKRLYPRRNVNQHEQMVRSSMARATNWSKEKLLDDDTLQVLTEGTQPLIHPNNHDFRPRDKKNHLNQSDIYLRTYLPSGQRAEIAERDFKNSHLGPTPYLGQQNFLESKRIPEKELGPSIRFGLRTENERLASYLDGPNRLIDPTGTENHMLIDPHWKEVDKKRWISKKDFDLTTCYYRGKKSKEPWEVITGGINLGNTYVDGVEIIGDVSRKRQKELEVGSKDFLTTVGPSHSLKQYLPPMESTSIRMNKAAMFFEKEENSKQKLYPITLKHVKSNIDNSEDQRSNTSPIMPQIIQIKSGLLEPLKESAAPSGTKKSDVTPQREKSLGRSTYLKLRRRKTSSVNREEQIRQTIKSYFD